MPGLLGHEARVLASAGPAEPIPCQRRVRSFVASHRTLHPYDAKSRPIRREELSTAYLAAGSREAIDVGAARSADARLGQDDARRVEADSRRTSGIGAKLLGKAGLQVGSAPRAAGVSARHTGGPRGAEVGLRPAGVVVTIRGVAIMPLRTVDTGVWGTRGLRRAPERLPRYACSAMRGRGSAARDRHHARSDPRAGDDGPPGPPRSVWCSHQPPASGPPRHR